MNNTIIYQNESALHSRTNQLNEAATALNNALKELAGLNLIKINSITEVSDFITNNEEFVKTKIANELPVQTFGLFKLKKRHAVDLLDLPSFEKMNELCHIAEPYVHELQYMVFKSGQVVINPTELNKVIESYSIILQSDAEEKAAQAHSDLAKNIAVLQNIFFINGETKLSSLLNFEESKKPARKGLFWYNNAIQLNKYRSGE